LLSSYILPTYSPITPNINICKLENNSTEDKTEAHPLLTPGCERVQLTTNTRYIKLKRVINKPMKVIILIGITEKEKIPLIAKDSFLEKLNFELPFCGCCWCILRLLLNPNVLIMPGI